VTDGSSSVGKELELSQLSTHPKAAAPRPLAVSLLIAVTICMRRRSPHDTKMMSHDYETVDPEDLGDLSAKDGNCKSGKSLCPRSYKARRQLKFLSICIVAGLCLLGAVRRFRTKESSTEGKNVDCRLDRTSYCPTCHLLRLVRVLSFRVPCLCLLLVDLRDKHK
jgi:hypothetical protein